MTQGPLKEGGPRKMQFFSAKPDTHCNERSLVAIWDLKIKLLNTTKKGMLFRHLEFQSTLSGSLYKVTALIKWTQVLHPLLELMEIHGFLDQRRREFQMQGPLRSVPEVLT